MRASVWGERAEATTRYCVDTFWDGRAGRFRPATSMEPRALPWDFMWANGVAFSMLTAGLGRDRGRYRPLVDAFFAGLDGYWDADAPIPGYDAYLASRDNDDKYYDDNEWMVLTFVEAYERTGERKFLNRAAATQRFVLSGWDTARGGIFWRQDHASRNTCSNGPGAAAALALARHVNPGYFVPWARRIVDWTNKTLQDGDGLFFDNVGNDGRIEKTKWTYNTALMLRANLDLWRATGEKPFRDEAVRLGEASEKGFVNPDTGAFRDEANFSHLLCEAFLDLYKETRAPFLLRRVEACANFAWTELRDPKDGGHWTVWRRIAERKEPRKTLMANASTARLYALLAQASR